MKSNFVILAEIPRLAYSSLGMTERKVILTEGPPRAGGSGGIFFCGFFIWTPNFLNCIAITGNMVADSNLDFLYAFQNKFNAKAINFVFGIQLTI